MKLKLFLVDLNFQKLILTFVLFFQITFSNSQNYRNAVAYVNDFGRNETFINASMMEYSKTIALISPENRVNKSSTELVDKLVKLNEVLATHDKGFKNDTRLRDAMMELNTAVSVFMTSKTSDFNDYKSQSLLSIEDITENFRLKELDVEKLYQKFRNYEMVKKEFGEQYNIPIKFYSGLNIYEYNTYQNLIFYKINVLDEKLMFAITNRDIPNIQICKNKIVEICNESLQKTKLYRDQFIDETLNSANILFSNFFLYQDITLLPITINFFQFSEQFQILKCKMVVDNSFIPADDYNKQVRTYNSLKNNFYDTLYEVNAKKNTLINNWVTTNSSFLKNNCSFDISNYKFLAEEE